MAALARELSITYGGYTVGGSKTNRILEAAYTSGGKYEQATLGFHFVLRPDPDSTTPEADFIAAKVAAEAAFRKPRQACTVVQGGGTPISYSHSGNTGFNSDPQILKREDNINSGRACRYHIEITFGLPADNVGTGFRRYARENVAYTPARKRTLTMSGTYTAGGSDGARKKYEDGIAAYAASVQASLTGTWKLLQEPQTQVDDQDKVLDYSLTYEEVLPNNPGVADATLRGERFTVTRSKFAPGDTDDNGTPILRLANISATYEAWFDKGSTQDLKGKWDGTYRDKAVGQMSALFAGSGFALVEESPSFDITENKITCRLSAQGASAIGVVQYTLTITNTDSLGVQLVPVMNGRRLAKYKFPGPGSLIRQVTQRFEIVGSASAPALPGGVLSPPGGLAAQVMVLHDELTPITRGIPPYVMEGVQGSKVINVEFYEPIAAAPSDGGTPTKAGGGAEPGAGGGAVPSVPFGDASSVFDAEVSIINGASGDSSSAAIAAGGGFGFGAAPPGS